MKYYLLIFININIKRYKRIIKKFKIAKYKAKSKGKVNKEKDENENKNKNINNNFFF